MALTPTRRGVRLPDAGVGGRGARLAYWTLLAALLVLNLLAAARARPPQGRLPADGATYAFQAASLAFDLDLQYGREDYERFVAARGGAPGALVLRSPDRGERITYGVPIPYAALAAPVVRLAPVRGLQVANALFLALAALAAAATLERRLGPAAPLWVAAFVFASLAFSYTSRPTPELFAAAAVAGAFALAYRGEGSPSVRFTEIFAGALPGEEAGRSPLRWIAVGALAATAAAFHPFYLALLWPLALAVPRTRRRAGVAALLLAAVLVLAAWGGLYAAAGGSWLPWDRGGRVFTPETGFPAVDVPVAAWPAEGPAPGGAWRWLPGGPPEVPLDRAPAASLWGWNALFLLAGRHLGLLPYFLPMVLGFLAFHGERGRGAIPLAVGAALFAVLLVRPFGFAAETLLPGGAPGGLGNGFFLALYPALWFLAARPLRPAWVFLVVLAASPYLYPAWWAAASPAAEPARPSPVARRLLPVETTQTTLPGVVDLQHGALWVRFTPDGVSEGQDDTLRLVGDRRGDLWIGSPLPVPALRLELLPGGPARAEVAGAEILRTVLRPDGGVAFVLDPGEPDRGHRVAWSSTPYAFYHLSVRLPEAAEQRPFPFRVVPLYEEP